MLYCAKELQMTSYFKSNIFYVISEILRFQFHQRLFISEFKPNTLAFYIEIFVLLLTSLKVSYERIFYKREASMGG